jgi:acyl carrier protein
MIEKRLNKIFNEVLNIFNGEINSSEIDSTSQWDSLNHLRLMIELESEFGINLTPNNFQELTSYNKIIKFIKEVLGEQKN